MKINQNDICYNDTLTYKLLSEMFTKAEVFRKEAERWQKMNEYAVLAIQEGKITDTESLRIAIAWLNYSSLTPVEILEKVARNA
ncbi:MAG: hypothetical protein II453_09430 [Alphaproteobacteria bacterium]|nr:hypothetical protein [Alphaproteobacteria bacterium]